MSNSDDERTLIDGLLGLRRASPTEAEIDRALAEASVRFERPLAEILPGRGWIGEDDRTWLESLAARERKRGESTRGPFDPAATATDFPTRFDPGGSMKGPPRPNREGLPRYEVIRFHARGGLGQVSVAYDRELDRQVALKEIQDRFVDHPVSRARFLLEAEVTGKLQHPGIVPIYGRGETADGHPFYAMRFIEGESLKEAIDRFHGEAEQGGDAGHRGLRLRELLGRLLDACDAVAYAHDRGYVHRDIKPANIMLGPFGETLVVDWGLAKPIAGAEPRGTFEPHEWTSGTGGTPTIEGQAIGSPAFMSPEQASGAVDRIGPPSDVFNLGATLYCLLAGHAPYESGGESSPIERAKIGEMIAPRSRNPSIPRALEATCLKAMHPDAAMRYPTAQGLAQDLRRWLADEPVSAFREGPATRILRWARRHRTPVAASAALLLASVFALSVGLWQVGLARRQAERNALLARSRFALALDAFRSLVGDLQEQLKGRPGTQAVRDSLLKTAYEGVEKLVDQPDDLDDSDEARQLICRARIQAGDLALELGKADRAREQFRLARQVGERMRAAHPEDYQVRRDLAVALNRLGDDALGRRREDEAGDLYRAAEALIRTDLADPGDQQARRDAWIARVKMGDARKARGDASGAKTEFLRAVELARARVDSGSDPARSRADLANSLLKLGQLARANGAAKEAEVRLAEALREVSALLELSPADPIPGRRLLSIILDEQGDLALMRGQDESALAFYGRSMVLTEAMHRDDPADARFRRNLSIGFLKLGNAQFLLQNAGEAARNYRRAYEEAEACLTFDPTDRTSRRDVSVDAIRLGDASVALGEYSVAGPALRRALALREGLLAASPRDVGALSDLFLAVYSLEEMEFEDFRPEEAMRLGGQALGILDRLEREGHPPTGQGFVPLRALFRDRVEIGRAALAGTIPPGLAGRSPDYSARVIANAMIFQGRSGRWDAASLQAQALASLPLIGETAKVAATALARIATLLPDGSVRAEVAERAVGLLGLARSGGWFDTATRRSWLDRAEEIAPLRSLESFRELRNDVTFPADPFRR